MSPMSHQIVSSRVNQCETFVKPIVPVAPLFVTKRIEHPVRNIADRMINFLSSIVSETCREPVLPPPIVHSGQEGKKQEKCSSARRNDEEGKKQVRFD